MVEKFKTILNNIVSEKGPVNLFGLFKMDEITDKWSVILSADWINDDNRDQIFKSLVSIINKIISKEESNTIARFGLFPSDSHLIQLLLEYKKDSRIQDQKINGNIIHDGYILESNKRVDTEIVPIKD